LHAVLNQVGQPTVEPVTTLCCVLMNLLDSLGQVLDAMARGEANVGQRVFPLLILGLREELPLPDLLAIDLFLSELLIEV